MSLRYTESQQRHRQQLIALLDIERLAFAARIAPILDKLAKIDACATVVLTFPIDDPIVQHLRQHR